MKRLIILAAGRGTRLAPLTDTRPKCMVHLAGRPLLEWQIGVARAVGIEEIVVVRGYRAGQISFPEVVYVSNPDFAATNMVFSLWCARDFFGQGFIVAYSDIVYNEDVLAAMCEGEEDIAVAVDRDWLPYWQARFDDVLSDAETLRLDTNMRILEIGQKPKTVEEIQGQYVGIIRFGPRGVATLKRSLEAEENAFRSGGKVLCAARALDKMYMTDLLQGLLRQDVPLTARCIRGGWVEIDSHKDLELATRLSRVSGQRISINR